MSDTTLPAVPVPTIGVNGCAVPTYEQYYTYVTGVAAALYGSDINLAADTQDGQLLGALALAMSDTANAVLGAYNAFSPLTAQGVGLSSVVKINGIQRKNAYNSTVNIVITGVNGKTITNGIVADDLGNQWALPATVTILTGSTVTVTATAVNSGPVAAAANSITNIVTPTSGWYSCNNPSQAAIGSPVQSDGALRQEQALSTAIPSQTLTEGLAAAILTLTGVEDAVVYENFTDTTDGNGTPPNTIWCVILGGQLTDIVSTIAIEKSLGCGLRGSTTGVYNPPDGQPAITISYDVPTASRIICAISINPLSNYTSSVGTAILAAIAAYINNISMTVNVVEWDECIVNAKLVGTQAGTSFRIASLTIAIYGNSLEAADIAISPGYKASCNVSDITLTVI